MRSGELSPQTKTIIAWLKNPITERNQVVSVKIGERTTINGRHIDELSDPVTQQTFNEIYGFSVCAANEALHLLMADNTLTLCLDPQEDLEPCFDMA